MIVIVLAVAVPTSTSKHHFFARGSTHRFPLTGTTELIPYALNFSSIASTSFETYHSNLRDTLSHPLRSYVSLRSLIAFAVHELMNHL